MVSLLFLLIAIVPIACGVYAWVTRDRRPAPPTLPVARLVRD